MFSMKPTHCEQISFQYPDTDEAVFQDFSLTLEPGVTSLVGPNGSGKSTFLLLASGIWLPDRGRVLLHGIDTADLRDEADRQPYVSFIFQNMEFESEDSILELLQFVHANGFRDDPNSALIDDVINAFDLERCVNRKTQEVSKGELQRAILAFSLLYGSKILMMDEPIFALEEGQKHRAMQFLTDFARREQISLYYSVHELELSRQYSDHALLFQEQGPPVYGPTDDILTREHLEAAYNMPLAFLKQRQSLYREGLSARYDQDSDEPGDARDQYWLN